ncbi:MAG: T9SS type A sorting domain-containing protein [Bacteroidales bacterium]|nr:T9SS type A sorting domain-containing protein [Bacteroidales bacterium]
MTQDAYAYSGEDSRNGCWLPTQGTLKVLVVFAEVTGDPDYNSPTGSWVAGKMPPNADKLFDKKVYVLGSEPANAENDRISVPSIVIPGQFYYPTNVMTKFFYDASFGNLVVTGDYYPNLIQIPYSELTGQYDADIKVMDVLASKSNLKSATGLSIPADFDAWTRSGDYLEKNKTPDGKIDNLIIIYRVNSRLTTTIGAGQSDTALSSKNGKLQSNCYQSMRTYDFLTSFTVPHEFSHALLGGNNYHNGSAGGAGARRFITEVGGYGILENFYHNLRSCNAWDRYRLGWKQNKNYPDIYACDLAGNIVNGNVSYRIPTATELKSTTVPMTQEYVLRDFITTGDAIRIKLPYVNESGVRQWIWLENHVRDSTQIYYSKGATHPMGVRINLQVESESFDAVGDGDMRTSYYAPFSCFGRWDFDISQIKDDEYRAKTTSDKNNAFTGNSILEFLNYDVDGNGKLQDKEVVKIKQFYKDDVRIGGDYPILGTAYDVFRVGDVLSMATNPSTTPWLTHQVRRSINDGSDNRKIYLNGLKIHIKEKRTDGSVVVTVSQGYYTVNQNQRWCGDIVLNEKISLNAGKKINLALGKTPVVKETPIVINNKRYFTEPTVLTCMAHSVLSLDGNSAIEVDSLCALVLKNGSILENGPSSGITQIRIKRGGTLIVESGVSIGKGILFILDGGAYACVNSTVKSGMNLRDGGSVEGVHPYLQQTKKLRCSSFYSLKAKFGSTREEQNGIYQSFFEGNPVYNQVGKNQTACGYSIPIYQQGLEGDTVVDGLLYHKMSVRDRLKSVQFWVRESEAHDKVWVRLPWDTSGQDILVVDMTLDKGDNFVMDRKCEMTTLCDTVRDTVGNTVIVRYTYTDTVICKETCYVVDSVYYLEHPGGMLKHIRLSPQGYNGYTAALEYAWVYVTDCNWRSRHLEFIEGVGSNLGFVYHRLGASYQDSLWGCLSCESLEAPTDYIVCMERNNAVYYEHPNAECVDCDDNVFAEWNGPGDYPTTIANERVQSMSRNLLVSPNPAAETATLQWDAATDSRVSMAACNILLYDMQGVRLRSYTTGSWPYTLSVSDLAPGAYLLRVTPAEAPAEGAWQATVRLMVR